MPPPRHAALKTTTVSAITGVATRAQRIFTRIDESERADAYHLLQSCLAGIANQVDIFPEHPEQTEIPDP